MKLNYKLIFFIIIILFWYNYPTAFFSIKSDLNDIIFVIKNGITPLYDIDLDNMENKKNLKFIAGPPYKYCTINKKEDIRKLEYLRKENSIFDKINVLLTPVNYNGSWKADSIFRKSCNSINNIDLKIIYLQGFTGNMLKIYQKQIFNEFNDLEINDNYFDNLVKFNCNLFWILHVGRKPNNYEFNFIYDMFDVINRLLNFRIPIILIDKKKIIWRVDSFSNYFKKIKIEENSIVSQWLKNNASKDYCYIEMVHNIFAMAIAWTSLVFKYIDLDLENKIPEPLPEGDIYDDNYKNIKLYLQNIIHMIIPAPAISSNCSSKNNSNLDIHNLNLHKKKFDMNYKNNQDKITEKCPFRFCKDQSGSYVSKGTSIASYDDSNVAFGIGCRRCPGEEITLLYFFEFINFYNKKWKNNLYCMHKRYYYCGTGKVSWFEKK